MESSQSCFRCIWCDLVDTVDGNRRNTDGHQLLRSTDPLLAQLSHNQFTTAQASLKRRVELPASHHLNKREVPCRHPTCHPVLEPQTAFPQVVSHQIESSKKPIGYSIGNGNHRSKQRKDKMEREKTFSAIFANLAIRPAAW